MQLVVEMHLGAFKGVINRDLFIVVRTGHFRPNVVELVLILEC